MRLLLPSFALLSLLGCARISDEMAKSASELNADASHFDGKTVLVHGYVTLDVEWHNIFDSQKLNEEYQRSLGKPGVDPKAYSKYCLTIINAGELIKHWHKLSGQVVTISGKFSSQYLREGDYDLGGCGLPTGIYVDYSDLKRRYGYLMDAK